MVTTLSRAQRMLARIVAVMVLAVAAVLLTAAAPASSMPLVVHDQPVAAIAVTTQAVTDDDYLPVNRWAGVATSLHLRGGDGILSDLANRLQRDGTYPMLMGVGNFMWSVSATATTAATRLDLLTIVGAKADAAGAQIGQALMDSGIVVVLVVATLAAAIWRASRGRSGPWKHAIKSVLVVAVMAVMITGAQASTETAGVYKPGKFSPGWIATQANTIVATLASAPAAALSFNSGAVAGADDGVSTGALSCTAYAQEMSARFTQSVNAIPDPIQRAQASVPMLMSRMWESTGLEVWKQSQFGDNEYADFMYCRLLESRAGVSSAEQISLTAPSGWSPEVNPNSAAWGVAGDNGAEDRNLVAWSICRPDSGHKDGWAIAGDWGSVTRGNGKHTPNTDDCKKWWADSYYVSQSSETNGIVSRGTSNLEFSGNASDTINDTMSAPMVRDFLISLHGAGSSATSNLVLVWTYVLSAFICMIVFFVISGAVLIAKVVSVVMIIVVFVVALKDLMPGSEGSSALTKYFKSYLGVAFVAFGASLIFAFIALITGFLVDAASSWFGGASTMTMLWTGLSPLIAVVGVHLIFKKVLKMPSPFSLSGAQSWAAAAGGGAIGGAMGAGITNSIQNRGAGFARSAARSAAGSVTGRRTAAGGPVRGGAARKGGFAETSKNNLAVGGAVAAGAGAAGAAVAVKGRRGRMAPGGVGAKADKSLMTQAERRAAKLQAKQDAPKTLDAMLDRSGDKIRAAADAKQAARREVNEAAITRRGYAGGKAGDVREALAQRVADTSAKFAERPVRQSLKTAGTVAGGAGLLLATGGLAAPVMAGVAVARQSSKMVAARRFAVANGNERAENARAAAAAVADTARRERTAAAQRADSAGARLPGAETSERTPGAEAGVGTTRGPKAAPRSNGRAATVRRVSTRKLPPPQVSVPGGSGARTAPTVSKPAPARTPARTPGAPGARAGTRIKH